MHARQTCKNVIKLMRPSSDKMHRGWVSHPEKGLMNRFLNSRQRTETDVCLCGSAFVQPQSSVCGRQCDLISPVSSQRGFLINAYRTQR